MKIRRLAHALGAEVLDVDLSAALEPATFRAIRQAWIEHLVLVFPGQDRLTPDAHVAFSRLFGTLDRNEVTPSYRLPGYEEVIEITNRPTAAGVPSPSRDVGRRWHSDLDFTLQPTMGSLLWCGQLPEVGGDTMFANMYQAYETLSAPMKAMIADVKTWSEGCQVINGSLYVDPTGKIVNCGKFAALNNGDLTANPKVTRAVLEVSRRTAEAD